jgi:hypothetical protein
MKKIIDCIIAIAIVAASILGTYVIVAIFKNDWNVTFFKPYEKIYILISFVWSLIFVISHKTDKNHYNQKN